MELTSFEDAISKVLQSAKSFGIESIALQDAHGRVLKESICADRDFPPFDRVTMDGIAINWAFFNKGQRKFKIEDVGAAGAPKLTLQTDENCFEIMTGAILPANTDTVIRYEDVVIENGFATIQVDTLNEGKNVHRKGEDRIQGDVIMDQNKPISFAEIAVAATVGKSQLKVAKLPKAVIISTGDELVNVDETPLPHQIRKSNVHAIDSILKSWNVPTEIRHLKDKPEDILLELEQLIKEFDFIVMSGGVSKGKFDFVPDALTELSVVKSFHRVAQRPGKPFWFGEAPNGTLVFALPGNPISSTMCTVRYIKPWLDKSLGLAESFKYGILQKDVPFKPNLTFLMSSQTISLPSGAIGINPVLGHGSGDLASLVDADCFVELPAGKDLYEAGEVFRYFEYR